VRRTIVRSALLLLGCAASAAAQGVETGVQPAGRVDVLASSITAVQAGTELTVPAGRNLRMALVGALGGSMGHGESGLSARAELVGRFLLDPDFIKRWAPYAGGGIGARYDRIRSRSWSGVVSLFIGVEGPNWNGVVPFVELGFGGGGRFGMGLRKTRGRGR
jgi:hypothetical protein